MVARDVLPWRGSCHAEELGARRVLATGPPLQAWELRAVVRKVVKKRSLEAQDVHGDLW